MNEEIVDLLAELRSNGFLSLAGQDVSRARDQHRRMCELLAKDISDAGAAVAVEEVVVATPTADLAARIYRPDGNADVLPAVLYLHGGGHVLGNLDTHEWHARTLSLDAECVVVSVEYRKAPEFRWPVAAQDAVASLGWLAAHVDRLGGDPSQIGIAGDSAGANLAAVALAHGAEVNAEVKAALLLYPAMDFSLARAYPSRLEFGMAGYLTVEDMGWFGRLYAGKGAPVDDPDLSPINADVTHFPPTVVVTAELDPLRDEGQAFAAKLSAAGVEIVAICAEGMPHGFYDFGQRSPAARDAMRRGNEKFASHLRV